MDTNSKDVRDSDAEGKVRRHTRKPYSRPEIRSSVVVETIAMACANIGEDCAGAPSG